MKGRTIYINYSDDAASDSKCFVFSEIVKFIGNAIGIVHYFFLMFVRLIFSIIYGKGDQMSPIKDKLLLESVTGLAEQIRSGKIKSTDITRAYIARIKEINPLLNCVVDDRFKEALLDANKADDIIRSKRMTIEELEQQKPLLGIPFTTKDSIQVKNLINSSGLYLRKDVRAKEDAESIKLLRDAGAIPLAITNVPEICMWWESNNTLYGRCKNPYNTSRTPGGSSGGEGCIQAAAGSAFGLGSDIGGSIRMPSFFNGIFGHKPSKFIVSTKGQYPPSDKYKDPLLGLGPMCRYAQDMKLILKIIAGNNAKKLNLDEPVDFKKIKIYYQLDDGGSFLVQPVNSAIKNLVYIAAEHFEKISEDTPTRVQFAKLKESADIWFASMASPEGPESDQQLANYKGKINPYTELGRCLTRKSEHTLIGILNSIIERWTGKYGTNKHQNLMKKCEELQQEIKDLLGDDGVLLYPTHPTVAPYHWEPIFRMLNFSYTSIFNSLGFPATTVPMGLSNEGLPTGIQIIANHNQDRLCLAVAEELEKSFGGWVPLSTKK